MRGFNYFLGYNCPGHGYYDHDCTESYTYTIDMLEMWNEDNNAETSRWETGSKSVPFPPLHSSSALLTATSISGTSHLTPHTSRRLSSLRLSTRVSAFRLGREQVPGNL